MYVLEKIADFWCYKKKKLSFKILILHYWHKALEVFDINYQKSLE